MEKVYFEVSDELMSKQADLFFEAGVSLTGEFTFFMVVQVLENETFQEILMSYAELMDPLTDYDFSRIREQARFYIFNLLNRGYINAIDGKYVVSDMMKNPDVSHIKKVETTGELPEWLR